MAKFNKGRFSKWYSYNFIFRITEYATASTSDSVLIIGGYTGSELPSITSIIAEYKDGTWQKKGDLAQARYGHGAITSGSTTMIVGGLSNSGSS